MRKLTLDRKRDSTETQLHLQMITDLANTLDTQYLSNRDFSFWYKEAYYALCRIARKAIDISTFEETWKKSLATKKLSPQLVSLLKSRRKATVDDKRRLRKEFLDETAVDSLEEDAVVLSLFLA